MNCFRRLIWYKRKSQRILNFKRYISDDSLSRRIYWTKRYDTQDEAFDWLTDSIVTVQSVLPYLNVVKMTNIQTCNLLDLGCGNSNFAAELLKHTPVKMDVFCLDYTLESLELQRRFTSNIIQNELNFQVSLVCGDAANLPFKSNTMHLVIDKGTTDSILKDKENGNRKFTNALLEVIRVLLPNGKLLQFTDEDPDIRLPLLEQLLSGHDVAISYKTFTIENFEYFMYCVIRENTC